jgi:hypothetical protein
MKNKLYPPLEVKRFSWKILDINIYKNSMYVYLKEKVLSSVSLIPEQEYQTLIGNSYKSSQTYGLQ